MANSGVHQRTASPLQQINKLMSEAAASLKAHPGAVNHQLSAMLAHAQQDTLQDCAPFGPGHDSDEEPRTFKKSHTCGSLYAKCGCNNNEAGQSTSQLLQTYSQPVAGGKRSSNPTISPVTPSSEPKRLSNPEVAPLRSRLRDAAAATVVKANVYLNHPEITFPIPVELSKKNSAPDLSHSPTTIHHSEVKKSNLDYHKFTALAYESNALKNEEAKKFLEGFGIFGPMGNGVAALRKHSRGSYDGGEAIQQIRKNSKVLAERRRNSGADDDYWKSTVGRLRREIADWEAKYRTIHDELADAKKALDGRECDILKLQREVHKLKSVLQQTTTFNQDILASLQRRHAIPNGESQCQQLLSTFKKQGVSSESNESDYRSKQHCLSTSKKQGVSAESSETEQVGDITIAKHDKDFRSRQLIKNAIEDNDFLNKLDTSQMREVVDCMYPKQYLAGSFVIREGEMGAHLFVSAEGEFEVIKDGKVLDHMGPGKAFGELAILYNCTRTASIRVVVDSKVWVLDRKVFQQIMVRTGLQRFQDNINFLRSVPLLAHLSNDDLTKISDALEIEFHPPGEYIIRQGASGDTFFIIRSGKVKVTQRVPDRLDEAELRMLQRGDYFGEQALLKEDCRTASVIAMEPGVECLTLDRDSFKKLIGDLSEIREKDYGDEKRSLSSACLTQEFEYIELSELEVVDTLGIGGFGRVELVEYTRDSSLTFALKCLKKQHVVETNQEGHVISERNIMMSCRNPFICRLYRTYRDSKYVYMLLEACLGGEVWTILRERGCFDDYTTKFIIACVLEAFDYMHTKGVIYRDLKPENLLLDNQGYVKMVDFGFSKNLGHGSKTWTFCGTPEYIAPETILNKGHDRAVDYWALGILIHELLTGFPPFSGSDKMVIYKQILKGIDIFDYSKFTIGKSAQNLIKNLCKVSPSERLGYQLGGIQDIKKHKWFEGFDWNGLIARTLPSPIKQPVGGPRDTSNFDSFEKDNEIPPDEASGWDKNF